MNISAKSTTWSRWGHWIRKPMVLLSATLVPTTRAATAARATAEDPTALIDPAVRCVAASTDSWRGGLLPIRPTFTVGATFNDYGNDSLFMTCGLWGHWGSPGSGWQRTSLRRQCWRVNVIGGWVIIVFQITFRIGNTYLYKDASSPSFEDLPFS